MIIVYLINEGVYETQIDTGFPEAARVECIDRKISQVIDIGNFNNEPQWNNSIIFDVKSLNLPLVTLVGQIPKKRNAKTVFFSK